MNRLETIQQMKNEIEDMESREQDRQTFGAEGIPLLVYAKLYSHFRNMIAKDGFYIDDIIRACDNIAPFNPEIKNEIK